MAVDGAFLEAHSYAGGLRHTPLTDGGARPGWAPPADSVGWRDDFAFDPGNVVVEINQREAVGGGTATWIGVFHRSIDSRLGDRGNHAGVGVWLHDRRVVDPMRLLRPLNLLSQSLARTSDPATILGEATSFVSDRFLGAYIVAAERLPLDWRGVPAAATTLVENAYRFASAPNFDAALGQIGDEVARVTLGWSATRTASRTLVLITPSGSAPSDRPFEELPPGGSFLADVLDQLPRAFKAEQEAVRAEAATLTSKRAAWEEEQRAQQAKWAAEREDTQARWDAERREWEMLDRKPADLGGIAARLNTISRQLRGIEDTVRQGPTKGLPAIAPMPPFERPRVARSAQPASSQPVSQTPDERWSWTTLGLAGAAMLLVLAVLAYWMWSSSEAPPSCPEPAAASPRVMTEEGQESSGAGRDDSEGAVERSGDFRDPPSRAGRRRETDQVDSRLDQ